MQSTYVPSISELMLMRVDFGEDLMPEDQLARLKALEALRSERTCTPDRCATSTKKG